MATAPTDAVDINTLAPRKPTWDLERDLAKKMEKLERRTDRAIAELVTKRLKEAYVAVGYCGCEVCCHYYYFSASVFASAIVRLLVTLAVMFCF